MSVPGKDQLQGWKEIATFLARDERTAKRWEKQRGLPVRRIPGAGRANVYALVPELTAWLAADHAPDLAPDLAADLAPEHAELADSADLDTLEESTPFSGWRDPSYDDAPPFHTPGEALGQTPPATPATPVSRRSAGPLLALALFAFAAVAAAGFYVIHRAGETVAAHGKRYTSRVAGADELYLQGVYLYEERNPAALENARRSFEGALAKDPGYAPAYAGLADTYLMLREYATMPSGEAYAKARTAAEHAVALDPGLAEAHASLGFIDFFSAWNARSARTEFDTALRLDPDSALTHHWYGSMLTHQARYAEALTQLNAAQRLQPTSSAILASKAFAMGLGGERDEAVRMLERLTAADASSASPYRILATLNQQPPRDIPRSLADLHRFADLRHDAESLEYCQVASAAFAHGGERSMWRALLVREQRLHPDPARPSYRMAQFYALLGETEPAIDVLEKLADAHEDLMIGLRIDASFESLHGNPQYQRMLHVVGVDPDEGEQPAALP